MHEFWDLFLKYPSFEYLLIQSLDGEELRGKLGTWVSGTGFNPNYCHFQPLKSWHLSFVPGTISVARFSSTQQTVGFRSV